MKIKWLVYLLAVIAIVYGFSSVFYHTVLLDVEDFPLTGQVTFGNDVFIWDERGSEEIDLGRTRPGLHYEIFREIENEMNNPVMVNLEVIGEIAPHVILEENNFELGPGEKKLFSIKFAPSAGVEDREYSGELLITKKRLWG